MNSKYLENLYKKIELAEHNIKTHQMSIDYMKSRVYNNIKLNHHRNNLILSYENVILENLSRITYFNEEIRVLLKNEV